MQVVFLILALILLPFKLFADGLKDRMGFSVDFYNDNVGVTILSPMAQLTKKLSETWGFALSMRLDGITAASIRNGSGTKTNTTIADAVSGASGRLGFEDLRFAPMLSMQYEGENFAASFGRYYSEEIDFNAVANFMDLIFKFNDKNTILTLGSSYAYEGWNPSISRNLPVDTKTTLSYNSSLMQLISPQSYIQGRYSHTQSDGFLASPYHYLETGSFVAFDRYPNTRSSDAFALQYVQQFKETIALHGVYRYYRDDWAMQSHTMEFKLYYDLFDTTTVGIKGRYYTQTKAGFVKSLSAYTLNDSYIVSDYRLSALGSYGVGISMAYRPEKLEEQNFLIDLSLNYYSTDKNNYILNWYGTPSIEAFYMSVGVSYDY